MKIKALINSLSLRDKAIIATTIFVIALMAFGSYLILSKEKTLYLEDKKNQARVLIETVGINFANAILYQEVGLSEERWFLDQYVTDLLKKEENILTLIVFDNNGIIIADSNLLDYGKSFPNSKDITETSDTVIKEARDKEGRPILEGITPLMVGAKKIATLRIEFSLKEFYEKLSHLGKRIVFITIFAISGSILLIIFGFNAMTRPLRLLAADMDGIEYGKYAGYNGQPPKREDEIGVLQRSFSSMVQRLKEADLKWENTFDSITDLISIHSTDYRIVKVNTTLARRFNTTPDALVGRYCWEVYHNSDGVCRDCPHAKTLMTGEPSTCEEDYSSLGGTFLTTTFPYLNEEGDMIGTIHVAKDISEVKRLHEKLNQSEKMASMGQMAAGIAHEINNPLNSILGYATYLLETSDGLSGREELDRIARAAARCRDAVRRFLDLARETPSKIEPVNVKDIAENILSMLYYHISSQKIEVVCEIGEDLWINADKGQIEEVFMNMILNACDAMPDGGKLSITAAGDDSWIKVNVSDTGCGIPKENLNKIFDPFFTTKDPGKGTGLGLAVSHTIIRNHGGDIDCQSEPGAGTTFTITLPIVFSLKTDVP